MTRNINNHRVDARKETARFKINAVSELTGVSQDVLRVWERRYTAVRPVRTAGGTRLYTDSDIWRVTLLRQGVAKGHPIGKIVGLANEELEKLRRKTRRKRVINSPHDIIVRKFIDSIAEMHFESAEAELTRAVAACPPDELIEKIFVPILTDIGDNWQHGEFGVAEEHLASNVLRAVFISISQRQTQTDANGAVVLATPEGERHELGLMLSAISAALTNWRVIYLGLETPAEEIARTLRLTGANLVGLSIAAPYSERTADELIKLELFLPRRTRVVIGGASGVLYKEIIESFGWSIADTLSERQSIKK